MSNSGLSGFVKIILMLPRLFVLGVKKIASRPVEEFKRMLISLARIPEFFYLAGRGIVRKFL